MWVQSEDDSNIHNSFTRSATPSETLSEQALLAAVSREISKCKEDTNNKSGEYVVRSQAELIKLQEQGDAAMSRIG